jgi:hypothetical protein
MERKREIRTKKIQTKKKKNRWVSRDFPAKADKS